MENIRLLASLQTSQQSHISVFKFLSLCMHGNSVLCAKQPQSFKQSDIYWHCQHSDFLCLVDSKISETQAQGLSIELSQQDLLRFHDFQKGETQLKAAIKLFRKRGGNLEDELDD